MFFLSFFFFSCVDREYDLENKLDATIALGGTNFTFPLGSVDSVRLNTIIKKDDKTAVSLKDGEYSILRKSQMESFNVMVPSAPPINFSEIKMNDFSLCKNGVFPSGDLTVAPMNASFDLLYKTLPQEIRSVKSFAFSPSSPVKITVKFTTTGVTPLATLKLKNAKIVFPKYIISADLNSKNELLIASERVNATYTKEINVTAFDFSKETEGIIPITYQTINVKKQVSFSGILSCTNINSTTTSSTAKIGVSISMSPATIYVLEGNITPSIKMYIQPLPFDVPSCLQDDDVIMDAQDPLIRLKVKNELGLPIEIKGILQGYRAGRVLNQVSVKPPSPILVDANGQTTICLSRTGQAGEDGTKKYRISDLNNLIVRIPDQIRFSVDANAVAQSIYKVELGKKYKVSVDSEIEVPLKFGPGLSVIYNDTIDHFNKQLKGIIANCMSFTVKVDNSIPLVLKLEAFPIGVDKEAGYLKGIFVRVTGDINSCNIKGVTQESRVTVEIAETIPGTLKQLDGLIFRITAISTETINGMPLRESQFVRIKDIRARVTGGLNIDLNKN